MKAIRIHGHGGPEVLRYEDVSLPEPAPDEVRIRHTLIGVNYSDLNVRRGGFYPAAPSFPTILGNEAAGIVERVGRDVTSLSPGQRVAYMRSRGPMHLELGSYAEARNVPAIRVHPIPEGLSDEAATAVLLKGLTAATLIHRFHTPAPGETILVHAAASGIGLLLTAWSRHLGATVIGTAGSAAKAELARRSGATHCILYRETDFRAAVRDLAPEGVDVVFDSVGRDTLLPSLEVTRPRGKVINYGNASGPPPAVDLFQLPFMGSPWVTRAGVELDDLAFYHSALDELFGMAQEGVLAAHIDQVYPLSEASSAHAALEAGGTAGAVLLRP